MQIISERLGSEGLNGTGMSHWTICKASGCAVARASSSGERVREIAMTVALNVLSRDEVAARPIPLCRPKISQRHSVVSDFQQNLEAPVIATTDIRESEVGEGLLMPIC